MEDEDKYYVPLLKYFEREHYEVSHVSSWRELMTTVESGAQFNLVLLDLVLGEQETINPAIKSIASIRKLQPFLPILVITRHATAPWIELARNAGADGIIIKPPEITESYFREVLLPRVEESLSKGSALDSRGALRDLRQLREDDLISQLIVPLLERMDYSRVRSIDHHGGGEFGMDILPFYKINEFGERQYTAVQAKSVDISSTASSQGNVNALINQAEAALTKTFLDEDNLRRSVDRVILITSGRVTPDAQAILNDYLERRRNVLVIDGNRLLGLLNSYNLLQNLRTLIPVRAVRIVPCLVDTGSHGTFFWSDIIRKVLRDLPAAIIRDPDHCYRILMEREMLMPTVIGDSFAMPHAYQSGLDHHLIVLCASNRSLAWTEFYERFVSTPVLFLSPEGAGNATVQKIWECVRRSIGDAMKDPGQLRMRPDRTIAYLCESLQENLSREGFSVDTEEVHVLVHHE